MIFFLDRHFREQAQDLSFLFLIFTPEIRVLSVTKTECPDDDESDDSGHNRSHVIDPRLRIPYSGNYGN